MKRKHVIGLLAAAAVSVMLGGCSSFAPVYGTGSAGIASARFNFAAPGNRVEQIILNRLALAFPEPGRAGDPVLSVDARGGNAATGMSDAIEAGEPDGRRVEATVTVKQDGKTVFSATRFTDTAFQSGKLRPTDAASAAGAQETAARSTAEALRAAILAGYRPGTAAAQ